MQVQRNATSALLNMTYSGLFNILITHLKPVEETNVPLFPVENRQQLVDAGAVPVLVGLLNSLDTDVQYYCTTALSNIAVDGLPAILFSLHHGGVC
jgi:vacuolar protein 8